MINNELVKEIERCGLDVATALHYCFALSIEEYDLITPLLSLGIVDATNEHFYRVALTNRDDSGRMICRFSLYQEENKESTFEIYMEGLLKEPVFKNNPEILSKLNKSNDTKKAYKYLEESIENFDVNILIGATAQYYTETTYQFKVDRFLKEQAEIFYTNFKPKTTGYKGLL